MDEILFFLIVVVSFAMIVVVNVVLSVGVVIVAVSVVVVVSEDDINAFSFCDVPWATQRKVHYLIVSMKRGFSTVVVVVAAAVAVAAETLLKHVPFDFRVHK